MTLAICLSCFVANARAAGIVVAWGDNRFADSTVPADLGLVTAIAVGSTHIVALKADGTIVSWGGNSRGQVTGALTNISSPRTLANPVTIEGSVLTDVKAIAAGASHTVVVKSNGTVVAWGLNSSGQVSGTPTVPPTPGGSFNAIANPVMYQGQILTGVKSVAAGSSYTQVVMQSGTIIEWGRNAPMQPITPEQATILGTTTYAEGSGFTMALKPNGTVAASGYNFSGQVSGTPLTNAPSTSFADPVSLNGKILQRVTAIAAGSSHSVALKDNGTLATWGNNFSGECTMTPTTEWPYGAAADPVMYQGQVLKGVIAIAAGGGHTVVLVDPALARPSIAYVASGADLILQWPVTVAPYRFQWTTNLSLPWNDPAAAQWTNNGFVQVQVPLETTQRFHRLVWP